MVSPSKAPQFSRPGQQRAILVDEILGPEEVVVRPLPPLLRHQSLVSGITLSGTGELLLLCDSQHLMELSNSAAMSLPKTDETTAPPCTVLRQRVLVVDDSITTRTLEKNILEAAGFEITTATDGVEALRRLAEKPVDLVVADIEMPNMDGITLTQQLRDSSEHGSLPIILVTSLESREDQERGMLAGADAYIVKRGFDQAELLTTINRLLSA